MEEIPTENISSFWLHKHEEFRNMNKTGRLAGKLGKYFFVIITNYCK